ncbi:hypothetical protein J2Y88_000037 [Pseudomonas chlororaphis]|uniref:hypothetical protein n=1 Tax=Pseudomonas chlororaphis TaxID=587753 RepID=UPI0020A0DCEF|nr:hypothetical protein [Pseudomonas chlororaphis]MCP1477726.1 hypothetical protein [Pseudomonas chlororaphis]MCP1595921.1 hypothetical protein [Pseudomonas chlororaphis]
MRRNTLLPRTSTTYQDRQLAHFKPPRKVTYAPLNRPPEKLATGIRVSAPLSLDFPTITSPLLINLVPSGEHFYFACIDARTDGPWKYCLASLDTQTLEPSCGEALRSRLDGKYHDPSLPCTVGWSCSEDIPQTVTGA